MLKKIIILACVGYLALSAQQASAQVLTGVLSGRSALAEILRKGAELKGQSFEVMRQKGKESRFLVLTFQSKTELFVCSVRFEDDKQPDWDSTDCSSITTKDLSQKPAPSGIIQKPGTEPASPATPASQNR